MIWYRKEKWGFSVTDMAPLGKKDCTIEDGRSQTSRHIRDWVMASAIYESYSYYLASEYRACKIVR